MNALEAQYRYYECVIRLHKLQCGIEVRSNGKNYTKDEHGRFTGSTPGGGGGSFSKNASKALTKPKSRVKIGKDGKPFKHSEIKLSREEYGYFIHGVNTNYYKRYEGKTIGQYCSGELSKKFYFEIHGFDDYCVYRTVKIK